MLKNNDWIILNSIAFKIHGMEDEKNMRQMVIEQMKYLIDFDSASFYITRPDDEHQLYAPVGINYSLKGMQEYIDWFKNLDYSEGMMFTGKNIVYRESDLVPDEVRIRTEYYKKVYDVQGWHYSLHLNICWQEKFLGVMSFFRNKGKEDFEYEDIFVLEMLKDHLALRLDQERNKFLNKKMTVMQCVERYGLSRKEKQVLELLLTDKSGEQIADALEISVSTYRKHCNRIYQKMSVCQRIELYDKVSQ